MTGNPIINVNNNGSTSATALFLARQAVAGAADCVLVLGFKHIKRGALHAVLGARPSPLDRFYDATEKLVGNSEIPLALRSFGGAGLAHMQ